MLKTRLCKSLEIEMFDIAKKRSLLLSEIGFEWYLSRELGEARARRSLTGTASSLLASGVKCLLVGFDEPAYKLLEKAREWLLVAMEEKEVPRGSTLNGAETLRLQDIALCNWLLTGSHDAECLRRAISGEELDMASEGQERHVLELTLAVYLDAGQYERAIELFETTAGLSPPKSLANVRTEARMVYVLCKHRCRSEYSAEEVRKCLNQFLRCRVDEWLNTGLYTNMARWMKIAHWNGTESRESAREALLHCFDCVDVVGNRESSS